MVLIQSLESLRGTQAWNSLEKKEFFFKRKDLVFEELGFDGGEWKATSLLLFEKQYF